MTQLTQFEGAGVVSADDVAVAAGLARLGGETTPSVLLAVALCVRALRAGSVCVDLAADPVTWFPEDPAQSPAAARLPWPEVAAWRRELLASPLVHQPGPPDPSPADQRPLLLADHLLYLHRYWADEQLVAAELTQRSVPTQQYPAERLRAALDHQFPPQESAEANRQRLAVACSATRRLTIVAGGPGTGKTTVVGRLLAVLRELDPGLECALAAPTGKAAARLAQAVSESPAGSSPDGTPLAASTVHRLLGWRPDSQARFAHDRWNPLPHDVVVVDETSMVSLPLMARLLEAVRPSARVVLVGDPYQLASIEAGAVLADVVGTAELPTDATMGGADDVAAALVAACPIEAERDAAALARAAATGVVELDRNYRFFGEIRRLASAIHAGDEAEVLALLAASSGQVQWLPADDPGQAEQQAVAGGVREHVGRTSRQVRKAAGAGDAARALEVVADHRVLCAHRDGPYGVSRWSALVAGWAGLPDPVSAAGAWPVGQPLLITANDPALGLFNGDTGVIVADPAGQPAAAFPRTGTIAIIPPVRLAEVSPLHAMTIHKAQGSQFDSVTVVLPGPESRVLTRELFYTAVTRARSQVTIIGSAAAVSAAVGRRVQRASGLSTSVPRTTGHESP